MHAFLARLRLAIVVDMTGKSYELQSLLLWTYNCTRDDPSEPTISGMELMQLWYR